MVGRADEQRAELHIWRALGARLAMSRSHCARGGRAPCMGSWGGLRRDSGSLHLLLAVPISGRAAAGPKTANVAASLRDWACVLAAVGDDGRCSAQAACAIRSGSGWRQRGRGGISATGWGAPWSGPACAGRPARWLQRRARRSDGRDGGRLSRQCDGRGDGPWTRREPCLVLSGLSCPARPACLACPPCPSCLARPARGPSGDINHCTPNRETRRLMFLFLAASFNPRLFPFRARKSPPPQATSLVVAR
ncbi:hypothetical protein K505DRAFT_124759 [Melanomma pulvis-pyrius CBS 109.77]|uniref:Uncharacterized protein n=1 Tax=Melanomma pulvis-pyrius CBS 109.77 TaxID=1314802 RepID=A0A6A6XNS0_9PLEO|nr:hypothetical protein K505DRAFT_124759 [Melanomma pulvis-pyrius CBS 109.77]